MDSVLLYCSCVKSSSHPAICWGGTRGTGDGGGQELLARFAPDLYGRRSAPARSRTRPHLRLCASPLLHQPFGSEIWTKDKCPHVPSAWTRVLIQAPPFANQQSAGHVCCPESCRRGTGQNQRVWRSKTSGAGGQRTSEEGVGTGVGTPAGFNQSTAPLPGSEDRPVSQRSRKRQSQRQSANRSEVCWCLAHEPLPSR